MQPVRSLVLLLCLPLSVHGAQSGAYLVELEAAKALLLDAEYQAGAAAYQRLLSMPDSGQHAQALEYLGVAYERLDKPQAARSSYEAYLARFADEAGANRVQQRLEVLAVADQGGETPPGSLRPPASRWQLFGGISQDLWLDTYNADGMDDSVSQTNLVTFANFGLLRRGDRYEVRAQVDAGYQNALSGTGTTQEDQALVSGAYVAVADRQIGAELSLGRQSLYGDGVLGRFDGVRASYEWLDNLSVHATAGMAVDSPRYTGDGRRPFAGFSVHLDDIAGQFDVRPFLIARRNQGNADREAIGTELRWHRARWQLVGNLDYDLSYQTLNSAYLHGTFRWSDRMTLFARSGMHALPFLTTTNALIGQPFSSLETLADEAGFSEPQLRSLARDRTAQTWTASAGLTRNLSQRWYLTASTTYTDSESSIASGDVAARPSLQQFYSSANLVGSSIFRGGDTTVLGYSLDSNSNATTNTLRFELRLPFGNRLRIGPLLNLSYRDAAAKGDKQYLVQPGLRVTYRWRQRYRLELQGTGRWSDRELPLTLQQSALYPDDHERASAYFVQLGWRVDL